MNKIFVDTSALIAFGEKADTHHKQANLLRKQYTQRRIPMITSRAVLLELASYFSRSHIRNIAIELIEVIEKSKLWTCVDIDQSLWQRSFELYKDRHDKDWSLVDCIGIIIAKDHHVTDIFTNDHHFEQAGFQILLKS